MKSLLTLLTLIGVLGIVTQGTSQIQLAVGDIDVDEPEVEAQPTPQFQAGGVNNKDVPNPREWLELEVKFEVDGDDSQVVPELLFRYYVGFRDQTGAPRILTGDVKHKNIVPGDEYYSSAYVSPSTLGEITGDFKKFQPSSVIAQGVEVYYNGVIIGGASSMSGSKAKFWTAGTVPGILAKNDTPFELLWIDRYAQSEKK